MSLQELIALLALIAYIVVEALKLGLEVLKLLVVTYNDAKKITASPFQS